MIVHECLVRDFYNRSGADRPAHSTLRQHEFERFRDGFQIRGQIDSSRPSGRHAALVMLVFLLCIWIVAWSLSSQLRVH
jgi:hypothetical protein